MKTMKFTNVLFCSILTGLLFFSCSKDGDQGSIGPQGDQGEQGVAGANGADGAEGPQGTTGTANVIYSDWIASEFGGIPAAEQSEQLLVSLGLGDVNTDQDLIIIYGRRSINAISYDIFQLPYEFTNQNEIYRYRLTEGSTFIALYIETATSDGGTNLFTYFNDYRYVIIPGGISTSGKSTIDYSKMSYKEVVAHFNIPK